MSEDSLERELEAHIETLGYELVELERVGTKTRPILRIRVIASSWSGQSPTSACS